MILDTSAVAAVLRGEATAERMSRAMEEASVLRMSVVNFAELLVVAERGGAKAMAQVRPALARLGVELVSPSPEDAEIAASARLRFPINFGDCFCYALAKRTGEPILTLDAEFLKTDATIVPFD